MRTNTTSSKGYIDRAVRIICFVTMTILSLTYLFMYLWLLLNSFRDNGSYIQNPFNLLDFKNFTIEHYITLFDTDIGTSNRNSVFIMDTIVNTLVLVIGQVLLAITIPAITAYTLAKYKFKLKAIIFNIAVISMVVPTLGSMATTYAFISRLRLMNTYWGIFLMCSGGFGFGFLLFYNFFSAIPWEYAESAYLDGATDLQIFLKIMYPQATPIMTAIAITSFINYWNDYMTPYMYLPSKPTISLGVNYLYRRMEGKNYPVAFAGMSLLASVSLIIFAVFNKFIMNNMSVGGVKG